MQQKEMKTKKIVHYNRVSNISRNKKAPPNNEAGKMVSNNLQTEINKILQNGLSIGPDFQDNKKVYNSTLRNQTMLYIQKQFGNKYVQRLLAAVSKEGKEDSSSRLNSSTTGAPLNIQCLKKDNLKDDITKKPTKSIQREIVDPWTGEVVPGSEIIDPWAPRNVRWRIGYNEVFVTTRDRGPRGSRIPRGTLRPRAPWDILSIQSLVMTPQRGNNVVFSGSNPLRSGEALLGPQSHPVDQRGRVHGVIHYTREQQIRVEATSDGIARHHELQLERWMSTRARELLAEGEMRSEAELEETLATEGTHRLQELQRRSRNPGTLTGVNVSFRTQGEGHTLAPVDYPVIRSDSTINAEILITAERVETQYQTTDRRRGRGEVRAYAGRRQRNFSRIVNTSSFTSTLATHFRQYTVTSFRRAVEQMNRRLDQTRSSISGGLRGSGRVDLDLSASLSTGLSTSANLGTILRGLGYLVRHPIARRILTILGRTLNIPITLAIGTGLGASGGIDLLADAWIQGSYSRDELREAFRRVRTETSWANEVEQQINQVITQRISHQSITEFEHESSGSIAIEAEDERRRSQVVSGTGVTFQNPRARLRINGIER